MDLREFDRSLKIMIFAATDRLSNSGLPSDITDNYCSIRSTSWNGAVAQYHMQFAQVLKTR